MYTLRSRTFGCIIRTLWPVFQKYAARFSHCLHVALSPLGISRYPWWIFYECWSRWKNNHRALLFFYRNILFDIHLSIKRALCNVFVVFFFFSYTAVFFPIFPAALSVQLIESFICIRHKFYVIEIMRKNMHRFVLGQCAIGITASVCRVGTLKNLKSLYFELCMWREWPKNG